MSLRQGELVDRSCADGQAPVCAHAKQWTIPGMIRIAFTNLGAGRFRGSGVGKTTRVLDAKTTVAHMAIGALQRRLSICLEAARGLVVHRHHDATPWKVQFGMFRDLMMPLAKYSVLGADNKWHLVGLEEFRTMYRNAVPSFGRVEMFGQHIAISHKAGGQGTKLNSELNSGMTLFLHLRQIYYKLLYCQVGDGSTVKYSFSLLFLRLARPAVCSLRSKLHTRCSP